MLILCLNMRSIQQKPLHCTPKYDKSKSSKILRSRTTIQVGAEIFGDSSMAAELESIQLMLKSLEISGIKNITLGIGHAGFTASVLDKFQELGKEKLTLIEKALSKKSISDL